MSKGWMLFDGQTGNAIDMTMDEQIANIWREEMYEDEDLAVISFDVQDESDGPVSTTEKGGASQMAKKEGEDLVTEFKPKAEEGPDEPADDVAEAQPSLDEAAGGSTGTGSPSSGESGGTTQAGNSGGAASSSPGG